MTISRDLYENLPLYTRLADEQDVLKLFLERGIQQELDNLYKIVARRDVLFDPTKRASAPHLDWLGQLFGLHRGKNGSWVGIGLNPQWSAEHKRAVIAVIFEYWRSKGTEAGIVLALELWLQWNEPVVKFTHPFQGNWFTYGDRFAPSSDKSFFDRKRLGSGDYFPGNTIRPNWKVEKITGEDDSGILTTPIDPEFVSQSRLAEHNVWLELTPPTVEIADAIAAHLPRLIVETFDVNAIVTPICWYEIEVDLATEPFFRSINLELGMDLVGAEAIYREVLGDKVATATEQTYEFVFRPWGRDRVSVLYFYNINDPRGTTYEVAAAWNIDPRIVTGIRIKFPPSPTQAAVLGIALTSTGNLIAATGDRDPLLYHYAFTQGLALLGTVTLPPQVTPDFSNDFEMGNDGVMGNDGEAPDSARDENIDNQGGVSNASQISN